ncbi:MAG: helix-turn-helix transcriptional regulator [Candidatus Eremiobacteraeota bacterium]|nr:helix-turn-helix transcriptional regulator [Candidatus Eremiobacteraeota bacterium]
MPSDSDLFEKLRLELRRGCLIVAVLAQLRVEHYGYTLRKTLVELGLDIDEGTLYPLVRRLETQGLLVSEWREESNRKKRFYRLSPDGVSMLERLTRELDTINASLTRIQESDRASVPAIH